MEKMGQPDLRYFPRRQPATSTLKSFVDDLWRRTAHQNNNRGRYHGQPRVPNGSDITGKQQGPVLPLKR